MICTTHDRPSWRARLQAGRAFKEAAEIARELPFRLELARDVGLLCP